MPGPDPIQPESGPALNDGSAKSPPRVGSNVGALLANVRNWRRPGVYKPSIRVGLRLLLSGQLGVFYRQLLINADPSRLVDPYESWLRRHAITEPQRQQMRETIRGWSDPPRFSVVLPVYNVPERYLRRCIESVRKQIYPHWELCIADDASPAPHVKRVLRKYAANDPRIKIVYRTVNGNISAASNSALELVTAPWTALLDHDDELAEHALFRMAEAIVADPLADMIYSDEDKLTPKGERYDPFFKPDWSPEYLLACMYVGHLTVYRTERIRQVGGWRSAYDGSQDFDLALRVVATNPKIVHVPDILYHWRAIPSSAASGTTAKPLAPQRAALAIQDFLDRSGRRGHVEPGPSSGYHRVRFELRRFPLVSVVIPTACRPMQTHRLDTWDVLECVSSLRQTAAYPNVEILVVDDGSMPADLEAALRPFEVRRIHFAEPFHYARKMNVGVAAARGEQLLLMHDDVRVITPDFVQSMLEFSQWPEIGAVGAQLLSEDGRLQHSGITLLDGTPTYAFAGFAADHDGYFNAAQTHRNWSAVSSACMMTRADIYRSVGGMGDNYPSRFADVDYCLRLAEIGKRIVGMPYARLFHHGAASRTDTDEQGLEQFNRAWLPRYQNDLYFNPKLTSRHTDIRIG